MRTEFLTAETADTLIVIDNQSVVFNLHRFGGAVGDTIVAADAEVVIGYRAGGQGMPEVMFQRPFETEINVSHFCLPEIVNFQ